MTADFFLQNEQIQTKPANKCLKVSQTSAWENIQFSW